MRGNISLLLSGNLQAFEASCSSLERQLQRLEKKRDVIEEEINDNDGKIYAYHKRDPMFRRRH